MLKEMECPPGRTNRVGSKQEQRMAPITSFDLHFSSIGMVKRQTSLDSYCLWYW